MDGIHFAVVGADKRLRSAAETLRERGMTVSFLEDADFSLRCADAVLLPVPMSRNGIFVSNTGDTVKVVDVLDGIGENTPVFAGVTDGFCDPRLVDYTKEEFFAAMNAPPTAEGALAIVLAETEITVCGMNIGITGYGRVARATANLFHAVGAKITVFARREEARSEAEQMGYRAMPMTALSACAASFDVLINTVPEKIVTEDVMIHMNKETLILDLASMPGGIDFVYAKEKGIRAIHALALPGKYSPRTAGQIIAETVLSLFNKSLEHKENQL